MKAVGFFELGGLVQPGGLSSHMFIELFITSVLPAGIPCHVPVALLAAWAVFFASSLALFTGL